MGGMDGPQFFGEAESKHRIRLKAEKSGVGMVVDGATGPIDQIGRIPNMIPMPVGQQQRMGFELFLF